MAWPRARVDRHGGGAHADRRARHRRIPVRGRSGPRLGTRHRTAAPGDGADRGRAALVGPRPRPGRVRRHHHRHHPPRAGDCHRQCRRDRQRGGGLRHLRRVVGRPVGLCQPQRPDRQRPADDGRTARASRGLARGDVDVHAARLPAGAHTGNPRARVSARPAAGHGRCPPGRWRGWSVSGRPRARGPGRAGRLRDCRAMGDRTCWRDCRRAPGLEPDRAVPDGAADERRPGHGLVDAGRGVRDAADAHWPRPARACSRAWRC